MHRIILLRKNLGMSQADLAKYLNLSQQTISKYENGRADPDLKVLIKLSKLFNVSVDYLIGNSDERNYFELSHTVNCHISRNLNFGIRLKKARKSKNIKQADLGKIVGVSGQVISNLERGYTTTISPQLINKLSDVLDVSAEFLIHDTLFEFSHNLIQPTDFNIAIPLSKLKFQIDKAPNNTLNYNGITINDSHIKLLNDTLDLIIEHIKDTNK